jgi:hypothetical protein
LTGCTLHLNFEQNSELKIRHQGQHIWQLHPHCNIHIFNTLHEGSTPKIAVFIGKMMISPTINHQISTQDTQISDEPISIS